MGETSIRRSSRLRLSPLCAGFPTCGAKKVGSSSPSPTKWGPSPPFISRHITPQGELSTIEPRRIVNRGPANWSSTSLLRYDSGIGSEFVVAEGLEDFLSVVLAGCPRAAGVGNVGAFGRVRLPFNVETVVIARDGDDPVTKRDADQALHRGIARYLGQKLACPRYGDADRHGSQ